MFISDCKDVAVSCVIIEPTYNHEREGRGNFVQEGKSGELASPPSHSAELPRVAACQVHRRRRSETRAEHLPLSYSPSQQPRSLCHWVAFLNVTAEFCLLSALQCMHGCIGSMSQTIAVAIFFCSQTITGWQCFFFFFPRSLSLARPLSLSKLGSEVISHLKALKLLLMKPTLKGKKHKFFSNFLKRDMLSGGFQWW